MLFCLRWFSLNPQYLTKKRAVYERISDFVEKYKGVGDCRVIMIYLCFVFFVAK